MSTTSARKNLQILEQNLKESKTFIMRAKHAVFEVYSKLLKNRQCSSLFAIILFTVSFVQWIDYILEMRNHNSIDDPVFQFLYNITGYFRLVPAFSRNNIGGVFLIIGAIFCVSTILYATLIVIYTFKADDKNLHPNEISVFFLRIMSSILPFMLISPCTDIFLSLFICGEKIHSLDSNITCWSPLHITLVTIFIPILLLMMICAIVSTILYNEFNAAQRDFDALARMDDSYMELRWCFYKILLSVLSTFWDYSGWDISIIPLIGTLLIAIYFLYTAITRFPYYRKSIHIFYCSCIGINVWITFYLAIYEIIGKENSGIGLIFGCVFAPLVIYYYKERVTHNLLTKVRPEQIHIDQLFALFSYSYFDEFNNKTQKQQEMNLYLSGLVSLHSHECYNSDCPLRDPKIPRNFIHELLLKEYLNQYSKKNNASPNIHLFFSSYLLDVMKNMFKSANELILAEEAGPNFQEEYSIFRAKQNIVSTIRKSSQKRSDSGKSELNEGVDVRQVIKYEELVTKLDKKIQDISNDYVDFWGMMEAVTPDLNSIHTKGIEIMQRSIKIDEIWSEITSINDTNKRTNALYGKYVKELKNEREEGDALLEGTKNYQNKQNGMQNNANFSKDLAMFADDTGIIIVNSFGTIMKHNVGITKLFSYNSQEILGQNLQILMPEIIGKKHAKLVESSIETGSLGIIHKQISTVATHRFGHLLSIILLIKPVPDLLEGIKFIGFIRKNEKDAIILITDLHGKIEGLSNNLSEILGITPIQVKSQDIYIQLYFPELAESFENEELDINGKKKKITYLESMCQENNNEGNQLELSLVITKYHRELLTKMQINRDKKDESINQDNNNNEEQKLSTYDVLESYCKKIKQITGNYKVDEKNLIAQVIPNLINEYEDERYFKGHHYLYNYGDGMLKYRIFRLKLVKGDRAAKKQKMVSNVSSNMSKGNKAQTSIRVKMSRQLYGPPSSKKPDKAKQVGVYSGELRHFNFCGNLSGSENAEDSNREPYKKSSSSSIINKDKNKHKETPIQSQITKHKGSSEWEKEDESYTKSGFCSEKGGDEGVIIKDFIKDYLNKEAQAANKEKNDKDKSVNDDTSSTINSSTVSFFRQIQMMRNFVKQKVTPSSIRNLKMVAIIIFAGLIVLTSVFFVLSRSIFGTLNSNLELLKKAEKLLDGIVSITAFTRLLTFSNLGITQELLGNDIFSKLKTDIKTMAEKMQDAQKKLERINESNNSRNKTVIMKYNNDYGFINEYSVDAELSILSFSVHSLKISNKSNSDLTEKDTSMSYVLLNGLNNIIENEYNLFTHILNASENDKNSSVTTLLILLIIASASLILGLSVLIPVTISVGRSREEIIMMFTEIPLLRVKEEAERCRVYCTQLHCGEDQQSVLLANKTEATLPKNEIKNINEEKKQENDKEEPKNEKELAMSDKEEKEKSENEEKDEIGDALLHKEKGDIHTRKYVPFHNPIIGTIIKLFFLMLLLESYFLIGYFQSSAILDNLIWLTKEQAGIYSNKFYNTFSLRTVQEAISTSFKSSIMNQGPDFVPNYIDKLLDLQDANIKLHSAHESIHGAEYNSIYHEIVYVNMCPYIYSKTDYDCSTDLYGLPSKGLNMATVSYWELLRQVLSDFSSFQTPIHGIADNRLQKSERLLIEYLYAVYEVLAEKLSLEMRQICDNENKLMLIIFIVYLAVIAIIFCIWQVFISSTNNGLNSTRTTLGLIPPDVIREKKKIRDYMINTSKLLFANANN